MKLLWNRLIPDAGSPPSLALQIRKVEPRGSTYYLEAVGVEPTSERFCLTHLHV